MIAVTEVAEASLDFAAAGVAFRRGLEQPAAARVAAAAVVEADQLQLAALTVLIAVAKALCAAGDDARAGHAGLHRVEQIAGVVALPAVGWVVQRDLAAGGRIVVAVAVVVPALDDAALAFLAHGQRVVRAAVRAHRGGLVDHAIAVVVGAIAALGADLRANGRVGVGRATDRSVGGGVLTGVT